MCTALKINLEKTNPKRMNQIWNTSDQSLHPKILSFTAQEDAKLDAEIFLPYDIDASIAHAKMLNKMQLLSSEELTQAIETLSELKKNHANHGVKIPEGMEDGHTYLEALLTEKHVDLGKKIHTARSRNDQALTMIRLYMKDQSAQITKAIDSLIQTWSSWIKKHEALPMPGYTHMQKAMPTTLGMWQGAYLEALQDLKNYLQATSQILDQSPLGSAAGFGVPMELDRELTAKEMGFSKVQTNPIYCQLSRGPFEAMISFACMQIMSLISRWANDVLLFTTSEYDFFELPKEFCTSSSIMPQKKNYDALEMLRGSLALSQGHFNTIQNLHQSLHTGYHRDLQLLKAPLVASFQITQDALEVTDLLAENLLAKEAELNAAMTDELFATHKVYELVKQGLTFREAYAQVKAETNTL